MTLPEDRFIHLIPELVEKLGEMGIDLTGPEIKVDEQKLKEIREQLSGKS